MESGRVSRSISGNRAAKSASACSSGVLPDSPAEAGEGGAVRAMSLASMRFSSNRASTSFMAS